MQYLLLSVLGVYAKNIITGLRVSLLESSLRAKTDNFQAVREREKENTTKRIDLDQNQILSIKSI